MFLEGRKMSVRALSAVLAFVVALLSSVLLTVASAGPASAASSTTTLSAAPGSVQVGAPVTLTAAVTGTAPSGSVSFADGATALGTVPLSGDQAVLVVSFTAAGVHALTATYSGDSGNDVSQGTTSVSVTSPPPPPPPVPAPKAVLRVSTHSVSVGDKVRLVWRTKHATQVKAGGDWSGKKKPKGSAWVRVTARGKHVFSLTATNASGSRTAKVTVTATRKAKAFELPTIDGVVLTGAKVHLHVDGLAAGENFTVRLAKVVLATGKADKHGVVDRDVIVPKTTKEGVADLTLTGSNPSRVGSTPISVIVPTKALTVSVSEPKAAVNSSDDLTVTGLAPGEQLKVTYAGVALTTGVADAKGVYTFTFAVGQATGKQTITVVGAAPGRTGTTAVKVTKAPPPEVGRLAG